MAGVLLASAFDTKHVSSYEAWAVVGTALTAFVLGSIRYVVRPLTRLADAAPTIMEMAKEYKPNGGNSMRDVANRIEAKVDVAAQAASEAAAKADSVNDALTQHLVNSEAAMLRLAEVERRVKVSAA